MDTNVLNGIRDAEAQTPWDHCPTSFDEWMHGASDTAEFNAYWRGFDGRLEQAFNQA